MEKGDWAFIVLILVILVLLAFFTANLDKLFIAPPVSQAIP